jgi:hypothetical protein
VLIRLTCALAAIALTTIPGFAATPSPGPSLSPVPQGTEVAFVQMIQKDLTARFPTPADAVKAGYFRYTNEDEDGAISYANLQWQSGSPKAPSQLWCVNYRRWTSFREHVHYVLAGPNGTETYGATSVKKFAAAGGNVDNPQPQTVVKMGKAKDVADVTRVFLFPSIWDLIVWIKPNPSGAFADKNPDVIPSANAEKPD